MPRERFEIKEPSLLLVEGRDDEVFFQALCEQEGLGRIQVYRFGGVSRLGETLEAVTNASGFSSLTRLGIIRDADENRGAAEQSMRAALERAGLPRPGAGPVDGLPGVSILTMPPGGQAGCLESFLWEAAIVHTPLATCVEEYLACAEGAGDDSLTGNRRSKAQIHAYIALKSDPSLKVGEAARADYWNFAAPAFDPLRAFLRELAS